MSFRIDDGLRTDQPVFLGRATGPLPADKPTLVLEEGTDLAVTLDAQTHVRDPYSVMTSPWFGGDGHTRILLFADGVQLQTGEGPSALQVVAQKDTSSYVLQTEDVRPLPNFPSRTQIMVRLSDALPSGTLSLSITFHGQTSNAGKIRIK